MNAFRTSLLALTLVGAAVTGSPLAAQEARADTTDKEPPVRTASVQVANHNWLDMHIYAVRNGTLYSLGVVTGLSGDTLTVPASALTPGADFEILADPIGGASAYVSPRLVVTPGDVVKLSIENHLATSATSLLPHAATGAER